MAGIRLRDIWQMARITRLHGPDGQLGQIGEFGFDAPAFGQQVAQTV